MGSGKPRIMFLVSAEFESLARKNVVHMVLDRDEGGFFERVVTVHPFTRKHQVIRLNDVHQVYELGGIKPGRWLRRQLRLSIHLLGVVRETIQLVDNQRIDIIRATDPYWMGFIGYCVRMLRPNVKTCVSIHAEYDNRHSLDGAQGAPVVFGSRRIAKMLERFVLSHTPLILPIRDSLRDYAIANGARADSTRVIPHGINFDDFRHAVSYDVRDRYGLDRNVQIVSFVGRLSRENYVDDVLELARRLAKNRSDFIIVLAGGGTEENRLRALVSEDERLKRFIRMVGFIPREEVTALRQASAISLCLMGGFSLIEACAAASAVVAYDVEWHAELVHDGKTGFLVPTKDIDVLTERVDFLLSDQEKTQFMGQEARQLAKKLHSLEATSKTKVAHYAHLLESELKRRSRQTI